MMRMIIIIEFLFVVIVENFPSIKCHYVGIKWMFDMPQTQ